MKTAVLSLLIGIWGTIGNALGWVSISMVMEEGGKKMETPLALGGWILGVTIGLAVLFFIVGLIRQRAQRNRQ